MYERYIFQLLVRRNKKLLPGTTFRDKDWKFQYFVVSGDWGAKSSDGSRIVKMTWNIFI